MITEKAWKPMPNPLAVRMPITPLKTLYSIPFKKKLGLLGDVATSKS
jgi:hypothetical protein